MQAANARAQSFWPCACAASWACFERRRPATPPTAAPAAAPLPASPPIAPTAAPIAALASRLYDPSMRDVDLVIRTAGEMRVSNFLLWQLAYTELYITPVLWPDFTRTHLFEAILDYLGRERRFGRVTA